MGPLLDAVLLDARACVADARKKIKSGGPERVAVRRAAGLLVFWYVRPAQWVLERIAGRPDDMPLAMALDLHEHQASPVQDRAVDPSPPLPAGDAIILDGDEFVGIRPAGAALGADLPDLPAAAAPAAKPPRSRSGRPPAMPPPARPGGPGAASRPMGPTAPRSTRRLRTFGAAAPAKDEVLELLQGAVPVAPAPTAFTAYPRMDMPAELVSRQPFDLVIGLGSSAQQGTEGGPFTIALPAEVERLDLDLLLVADGFDLPQGYRYRLQVDRNHPEARSVRVPMVAPAAHGDALLTTVSVIYFHRNIPCGTAARRIAVLPAGGVAMAGATGNGLPWTAPGPPGGGITVAPDTPRIDLVVTISKPDGNSTSGQFLWSFASPHALALPPKPLPCDLGTDARDLGSKVIEGIQNSEAQGMVDLEIAGLASSIRDHMPPELWTLLAGVQHIVGPARVPSVLFLTAESHVPWELALVDPPLDAAAPPYLGCQVNMGRWPLNASGSPPLPPAASIEVTHMAVVVGDYAARSGWRQLNEAEQDGDALEQRYNAIRIKAAPPEIRQLLTAKLPLAESQVGAEAVHFACHGEALQGHVLDAAIILDQGQRMSPMWLAAAPLGKQCRPFLFLNACQVGRAGELLGSFSGFAGESLKGGFRGFLAPLWSVDDGIAHGIAIEFYARALGDGVKAAEPVAAILRDLRRRFAPETEKNSSTRLAYVFYGHPGLTLHRIQEIRHGQ